MISLIIIFIFIIIYLTININYCNNNNDLESDYKNNLIKILKIKIKDNSSIKSSIMI